MREVATLSFFKKIRLWSGSRFFHSSGRSAVRGAFSPDGSVCAIFSRHMGAVLGHGFHPLKARQCRSIPNLQTVHRQGRTPLWSHFSNEKRMCPPHAFAARAHCTGATRKMRTHLRKSGGGVFEITVDGKLAYSKKATGRFPTDEEVLATLGS